MMGIHRVESPSNPQIKYIRKLRQRKYRQQEKAFLIEGLRIVSESLRTRQNVRYLLVCQELLNSPFGQRLIAEAAERGVDIIDMSAEAFLSVAEKDNPQGIAAVVATRPEELEVICAYPGVWVGLVNIQDPGNLGSILRSADASGARGVILLGQTTDAWHPTAVRASMGALFTQRIAQGGLNDLCAFLQVHPVHIVGALSQDACNFRRYNYPREMILLMGSEQKGLPDEYAALCEGFVHIPMSGSVDSINLASAASIILFEIMHQHERKREM